MRLRDNLPLLWMQLQSQVSAASTANQTRAAALSAHRVAAGVVSRLCDLLRSPNRLVRTASSYGIEAVLKSGECCELSGMMLSHRALTSFCSRKVGA
jgi:hypothetical protein